MKLLIIFASTISIVFCASNESVKINCGGTFNGNQYVITSPNYPNNYPNNQNCIYKLNGDPSAKCEQEFLFQFIDFNIRTSENCKNDYLQIGEQNIFCSSKSGFRRIKGKNNVLNVIFHSDESETAKGFKILVTPLACGKNEGYRLKN